MSGYGAPPSGPSRGSGSRQGAPSPHLIAYAAGALGVLSFVWGFLSWYSQDGQGYAGYSIAGGAAGAAIGLSLTAGLLAAAAAWLGRESGVAPAVLAVAALLVTIGALVGKSPSGSNISVGVGLVLELVTTILQAVALGYVVLHAAGRLPQPRTRQAPGSWPGGASQYGQSAPPPGQFPPAPPPGGYAPAGRAPQGPQGPQHPGQQFAQPPAPPYGPPPSAYPYAGQHPGQHPGQPPVTGGASPYAPPPQPQYGAQPDRTQQFGVPQPAAAPPDPATEQWSPQQAYPRPGSAAPEESRPDDGEGAPS